jgi:hypothetical protein
MDKLKKNRMYRIGRIKPTYHPEYPVHPVISLHKKHRFDSLGLFR